MGFFDNMFKRDKPGRWDYGAPPSAPGSPTEGEPPETGLFNTGKPHGKDWAGLALGAIGDAFATANGGQAFVTPLAMQSIVGARGARDAAKRKKGVVDALIAKGIPESEASVLAGDNAQVSKILGGQYEYHKPDVNPKERDLAWYKNLSPEDKTLYDQMDPVIASTWQGPVPVPRNSLGGGQGKPAIGTVVANPFGDDPASGSNAVPSGSPLSQPAPQPQAPQAQQGGGDAFDAMIKLYGPVEGTQRYLKLIGAQ
jgi:hypothetical protein